MEFEWDESKRLSNIDKHHLDFVDAVELFENEHIRGSARPGKDGEQRLIATSVIDGLYATIIYTMRGSVIRPISLRRARRNERRKYEKIFSG